MILSNSGHRATCFQVIFKRFFFYKKFVTSVALIRCSNLFSLFQMAGSSIRILHWLLEITIYNLINFRDRFVDDTDSPVQVFLFIFGKFSCNVKDVEMLLNIAQKISLDDILFLWNFFDYIAKPFF